MADRFVYSSTSPSSGQATTSLSLALYIPCLPLREEAWGISKGEPEYDMSIYFNTPFPLPTLQDHGYE